MKITDLQEDGRIVKGVNTTVDVAPNEIKTQAAKFGNTVDKDGVPPTHKKKVKGKSTNVLFNLGLAEQKFQTMQREVMLEHKLNEVDLAVQQFSTRNLINYIKKLGNEPMDMIIKKAIYKELQKRKVKIENKNKFTEMQIAVMEGGFSLEDLNEITAVTNIDPNQVEKEDFDDHIGHTKKVGKIKGYEIHTAESSPHKMLKYHHFLVKDPESEGFLGELKLGAFQNFWVSEVWFTPEIQGKGLALPLYVLAIKKGYDLVSDREQSKGSQAIWKNLTKVPGIFVYAWDRKYDEFFQWDPDEDLDSEIYYRQEKIDKLEADYKDGKISDEDYKKAKDELEQVRRFSDVRLVAIDEKKNTKESIEENINENKINFTMPNFDFEWEEANRYEQYRVLGKEKWIKLAKTGKAVDVDNRMANDIENTEAGEEFRYDYWDGLVQAKRDRFTKALSSGQIELPIIARYSDGQMELISGNTRLTGMMRELGKAKAWIYDVPDEVADLEENLQERKNADLYHNTIYPVEILKSGKIKAFLDSRNDHEVHDKAKPYVSLTRDPRFDFHGMGDAQFVIDQAKLANTHKIVPFDYGEYSDDGAYGRRLESEERVFKDIPLSYVKKIVVRSSYNVDPKDYIPLAKELGIPVVDRKGNRLDENFADGEEKGKSRPGRVARAGASCKGSVTDLRKRAKKYSGEKAKMYHWCANMKSGRKKG